MQNVHVVGKGAASGEAAQTDQIFAETAEQGDFRFGKETAKVFDDMVGRSVPFYDEIQRMTSELAGTFAVSGSYLYDLGCATGTTLALLDGTVNDGVHFVGVDNSEEMLAQARKKLEALGGKRTVDLVLADVNEMPAMQPTSVVVMNLTLQFVRPLYRERVLGQIFDALLENGCLILVEKLTVKDSRLNRLFIEYYYDLKRRNGYSEIEIARKREALENVLIPYRLEENLQLLETAGFKTTEMFFRWYNFCGLLAVK
ncbi:MAG: carboxy-S-adenosyl-L-methionine synthase CmoA [Kiloniellaceae bacterium]